MDLPDSAPTLELLPGRYAVCRFDQVDERLLRRIEDHHRSSTAGSYLLTLSMSDKETSLVIPEEAPGFEGFLGEDVRRETGFRAFRFAGALDFALVGVLSSVLLPLSACGISVFSVSTFDTDYILVREGDLPTAGTALRSTAVIRDAAAGPGRGRGPSTVGTLPFSGRPTGRSAGGSNRRLALRPIVAEYVHPLLEWIADPRAARAWGGPRAPLPVTAEWLLGEWSKHGGADSASGSYSLGFVGSEAGSGGAGVNGPAAYGQILDIDPGAGTARLGRLIVDPARRGEGLGRDLVEGLLEVCFEDLGLSRVTLRVYRWNKPALLCYLSAGFRVEGIIPDAVSFKGESWDTVIMGCREAE